jgi:HD-GYP domain-containing protein (c-di-GMP phosphodiesterase class II)
MEGDGKGPGLDDSGLRLAELIGALSLATDLGMRQRLEHGMRTALIAVRLGETMGMDEAVVETVYYVSLLRYCGCTAEAAQVAEFFGDEGAARREMIPAMSGSRAQMLRAGVRSIHPTEPVVRRAGVLSRRVLTMMKRFGEWAAGTCEVAQMLAERLHLGRDVRVGLGHIYERWDGKGLPGKARGEDVPLAVRLMQIAQEADFQHDGGGVERAVEVISRRAGHAFDPALAAAFCDRPARILAGLTIPSIWDEVLAVEPGSRPRLDATRVDEGLRAIADFTDMKTPYTLGHSSGVADLARRAAERARLSERECIAVFRAGLVHDLGRVVISAAVWDTRGPLSRDEQEKVRLHPYYTERVLSRPEALNAVGKIASLHHERLDGSGYHRGVRGAGLSPAARILAAADVYRAMSEPRPHRRAHAPEAAADMLREEARAGRLDSEAVSAVLEAAGHSAGELSTPPVAGLSVRETEVLGLLAGGLSTKQIARRLGISPKTADNHIQHIYGKIGVSTRAGATLFALQHGVVTPPLGVH